MKTLTATVALICLSNNVIAHSAPGGVAFLPGAGPLKLIGHRWEPLSGDERNNFKFIVTNT